MKNFVKQITIGAVLGLAVMVSGVGQAQATLLMGNDIETTFLAPNLGTILIGPETQTVGAGIEYLNFGGANVGSIDLSDSLIKITALSTGTFVSDPFRGLRFVDVNNTIGAWNVTVNAGMTNISEFELYHTNNEIFLNLAGVTFNNVGDTIALDVKPVPEPSTMLLLGSGLAGVVAWRYRKTQA